MKHILFADKPAKCAYMWRDIERRAAMYGFSVRPPAPYPLKENALANKLAIIGVEEGCGKEFVCGAYRRWFQLGEDSRAINAFADTKSPLQHIARACGFGNLNTIRRAFVRNLGVAPIDYRKSFGSAYAEISAARAAPRRPHEAEAQKSRDRSTKKRQGRRGNDQRFAGIWR